jgi:hypothetical protein
LQVDGERVGEKADRRSDVHLGGVSS